MESGELLGLCRPASPAKRLPQYAAFLGVPYAKPPLGELRFKVQPVFGIRRSGPDIPLRLYGWDSCLGAVVELIVTPPEPSVLRFSGMPQAPRPVEPWQGVREAVLFDQRCIQGAVDAQFGSEDCLHVNVYSPWLQTPHSEVGNRTTRTGGTR